MMTSEDRAAHKALLDSVKAPPGTDDAHWAEVAKGLIGSFDGDYERVVKLLIIAYEHQTGQVAYLQGMITQIAAAYPGLVSISYNEPFSVQHPKAN